MIIVQKHQGNRAASSHLAWVVQVQRLTDKIEVGQAQETAIEAAFFCKKLHNTISTSSLHTAAQQQIEQRLQKTIRKLRTCK